MSVVAAVTVDVRVEHGAREVLEDAVHHQLHARRLVAPDRGRPATLDELLDLLGAAVTLPPHRADDARRQLAARGEGDVGALLGLRPDDGVLPGRDPQRVQVGLAEPQRRLQVGGCVVGLEPPDEVHRAFVERAGRAAVRVALDPAVGRVGGLGGHAGQLECPGVDPGAVAVAVGQDDRAIRHDRVEVLAPWRAAGEVVHVPAAAADPGLVRVASSVLGDHREVGLAPAGVVELAAEPGQTAVDRMDVRILETRRDRSAAKLDDAASTGRCTRRSPGPRRPPRSARRARRARSPSSGRHPWSRCARRAGRGRRVWSVAVKWPPE